MLEMTFIHVLSNKNPLNKVKIADKIAGLRAKLQQNRK